MKSKGESGCLKVIDTKEKLVYTKYWDIIEDMYQIIAPHIVYFQSNGLLYPFNYELTKPDYTKKSNGHCVYDTCEGNRGGYTSASEIDEIYISLDSVDDELYKAVRYSHTLLEVCDWYYDKMIIKIV